MNGIIHGAPTATEITLKRGPAGLGFNIVGGADQQCVLNDTGIYVAKIKENGAAALDGRLQEGDKILEINGHKLENLSHSDAVDLFRTAGEDVRLLVLKGMAPMISPSKPRPDNESSAFAIGVGFVLATAVIAAYVCIRFRHSMWKR
ncbi:synaptojanin-2-binding protein [Anguilla rostrata]|uniref:synaptojanin-2-binding protein n=1 Tax=Anguilla rostrata TaxID=7938 RepID=UPI0030CD61C6